MRNSDNLGNSDSSTNVITPMTGNGIRLRNNGRLPTLSKCDMVHQLPRANPS
jgi:hypothetical protein